MNTFNDLLLSFIKYIASILKAQARSSLLKFYFQSIYISKAQFWIITTFLRDVYNQAHDIQIHSRVVYQVEEEESHLIVGHSDNSF